MPWVLLFLLPHLVPCTGRLRYSWTSWCLLFLDSLLLEDHFDDFLSLSALLNQLSIFFFLNVQTLLSKSLNQSSLRVLSSSSSTWLYSSWMLSNILHRSLKWARSYSIAVLFLFGKRISSIILHFLIILPLIFSPLPSIMLVCMFYPFQWPFFF